MKDYSKYIGNPYGFITDIKMTPSKIAVTTAKSDENEPHEYDIKMSRFYLERYEKQYNLVIANQSKIIKGETKIYRILCFIGLIVAVASIGLIALSLNQMLGAIGLVIGISATISSLQKISNYRQEFAKEMKTYKRVLKNKEKIESAIQKDRNVTKYLDEQTLECLEENQNLKTVGIVDNAININFIDKSSLEGLSKLLKMTKISNALQEEPTLDDSKSKTTSKKKTLKK